MTKLISMKEAALRLGVSRNTLRRWSVDEGKIPYYDLSRGDDRRNRIIRYDLDYIDTFIRESAIEAL